MARDEWRWHWIPMMDSHQVKGQRRCIFKRSMRLPRVETPMGRSNMVERSAPAPRLKGSFLAWMRTHNPGHEESFVSGC